MRPSATTPFRVPSLQATPFRILLQVLVIASAAAYPSLAPLARAQAPAATRDRFARIIDRSDAVVMGYVLQAGVREVPVPLSGGQVVTTQPYARIAVERWIVGPDVDKVVDVRLGQEVSPSEFPPQSAQSEGRVIVYLMRSLGEWWLIRDRASKPDQPAMGLEILSRSAALGRIPSVRALASASAPESLAARADLAVVCSLERFTDDTPGVVCRVERVVAGTLSESEITVRTRDLRDLSTGRALLLLHRRPDSAWELLRDGASCYFLDRERVAHSTSSAEAVFARVAAAHARGAGGRGR